MTNWTASEIEQIAYDIYKSNVWNDAKRVVFSQKYPDFKRNYPQLFKTVVDSNAEYNDVKKLIDSLEEDEDSLNEIKHICTEIFKVSYPILSDYIKHELCDRTKFKEYSKQYPEFKASYPSLFEKVCSQNAQWSEIEALIDTYNTRNICETIYASELVEFVKRTLFGIKYTKFKYYKPFLFKKLCSPACDIESVQEMIEQIKRIENNEITQYEASQYVGEQMKHYLPHSMQVPANLK